MWGEFEPCVKAQECGSVKSCRTQSPDPQQKSALWGEFEPCVKAPECESVKSCRAQSPDPQGTSSQHSLLQGDSANSYNQKTALWGEIEPYVHPDTSRNYSQPALQNTRPPETHVKEAQISTHSSPNSKDEPSACLRAMIEAVAASGSPVKSQQLGEPDLSLEEKEELLMEQYSSKPLVFLERYQAHLKPEHTEAFSHLNDDCRVQFYCKEIQRRASGTAGKKSVRNHRYAALRALQKEGQYFSEEQMRVRDPLLYEQCIGQYLSEDEILQRSEEAMSSGPCGLSDLLINSYQEKLLQMRLQHEQDREQCAAEESEEEECEESSQPEWEPNAEEKAMLREEFLSQMHQRFLDGKDDFNYSEVDDNPDYDNLDIVSRDAEERYFDDDEEEEEEEDADMIH